MEAVKIIKKKYLLVDKPSRKTTILEIGFDHKDELLAKSFNENLGLWIQFKRGRDVLLAKKTVVDHFKVLLQCFVLLL